jgi:hypothetical protein
MALTKRPDPDGTFAVLDGDKAIAIGLSELDANTRIASDKAGDEPVTPEFDEDKPDPAGAKDGGRKRGKN